MNYRDPKLRDMLASEYALGTLQGLARKRFERLMRDDADLRRAVSEWQERLAPMTQAVTPITPPNRVWRNIEKRIRGDRPRESLWQSLNFWRSLALAASGFAFAMLLYTGLAPQREPGAAYVAVLANEQHQPMMVVRYVKGQRELSVSFVAPQAIADDRSLELWSLPAGGAPKSLGLVPTTGKVSLQLDVERASDMATVPALAVSLEPKGGSPTGAPTGPVLFSGRLLQL